jgi:hypothetical protein
MPAVMPNRAARLRQQFVTVSKKNNSLGFFNCTVSNLTSDDGLAAAGWQGNQQVPNAGSNLFCAGVDNFLLKVVQRHSVGSHRGTHGCCMPALMAY